MSKNSITALAKSIGFDAVGFAAPDIPLSAQQDLHDFLDEQHHGDMIWMEENSDRRVSPKTVWSEVQSIIVVGHNYASAYDPMQKLEQKDIGNISCYAQNEDYHEVIKKKLKALARAISKQFACEVKVFVDTAPIMEKPLAEQAGMGWQGKHTCIVSREFGSWLFLGEIFTTLPLQPDEPETDHCGTCTSCLDICPTNAFVGPHRLDARKCISYLTIEYKGHIDLQYRKAIGNRIYGCDDCLAVCPWNKFAQDSKEAAYHPRSALVAPLLTKLLTLDDIAFRELFRKSPVKRIGRNRFVRNALIAAGNSEDKTLIDAIKPLLNDASELVRAMAVWALGELATDLEYSTMKANILPHETNKDVVAEWEREAS